MMASVCAIYAAVALTAFLLIIVWVIVVIARRNWTHVAFAPHKFVHDLKTDKFILTEEEIDFEPRLGHYLKTAEVVTTLASASLVLIPRLTVTTHPEWFAFSMTLFGLCVLCLLRSA